MAILSAVGLGLGVLRHYWDIYTHRSVRGISFFFVGLDAAGDLTSLLSVGRCKSQSACALCLCIDQLISVIVKPIDVEGAAIYAVELALWIGIMWLGVIYNLREWVNRRNGSATPATDRAQIVAADEAQEIEMGSSEGVLERRSTSDSNSSSVFQTVGLRKRATELFRRSNRPKTCMES